ncbi:MAG: nucleotidyltransferase family protein [Acidobacteriota bacterium]|nr:nucleotidyltransferase family protein [Acidobacteriota bacterium]
MSDAAVILAAGRGSRFAAAGAGPKMLADLAGRALVTWALAPAIEAGLDEVVVVTGATDLADALPASVTVVDNPGWERGQAASLAVALDYCARRGHRRALVALGDEPGLTAAAWRAVRAAPAGPIVFATYGGRRGHPVRLDAEVWDQLAREGEVGARALARARPELVSEVECAGAPGDVDTLEDLQRWESLWN